MSICGIGESNISLCNEVLLFVVYGTILDLVWYYGCQERKDDEDMIIVLYTLVLIINIIIWFNSTFVETSL